jgi:hypothetical protein
VDWSALLSTVVGGLLVITSTTIAERARWKRSRLDAAEDRLRVAYASYFAAIADAGNSLRIVSQDRHLSAQERAERAHDAFSEHGLHARRYELQVLAPASIVARIDEVFVHLRNLRDLAEAGQSIDDPAYRSALASWQREFADLRAAVRADLSQATLGTR